MNVEVRALADTPEDVELGRTLVREYVAATVEEQGDATGTPGNLAAIEALVPDVSDFAGRYFSPAGEPSGIFLVVTVDGRLAGGVGCTPLDERICEMNRLWVRPPYRKAGIGSVLVDALLGESRRLGFRRMVLEVVPWRTRAIALYRSFGFADTDRVHEYPIVAVPFEMIALGRDL